MSNFGIDRALKLIKNLPRVSLANLRPLPGSRKKVFHVLTDNFSIFPIIAQRLRGQNTVCGWSEASDCYYDFPI